MEKPRQRLGNGRSAAVARRRGMLNVQNFRQLGCEKSAAVDGLPPCKVEHYAAVLKLFTALFDAQQGLLLLEDSMDGQ
jgi:hypothetical protein